MTIKDEAKLPDTRLDFQNGDRPTSYSGADFVVIAYRPPEISQDGTVDSNTYGEPDRGAFIEFANVQTLSVSMTRDVVAKRPLGSSWVEEYSRGNRTVAGSISFVLFDEDAFRDLAGARQGTSTEDVGFYNPDDIPEFNVVVTATNEYGQTTSGILMGVNIVNQGLAIGTQDVFTEQMFSYVARRWVPFAGSLNLAQDLKSILVQYPDIEQLIARTYYGRQWDRPRVLPIDEESKAWRLERERRVMEMQRNQIEQMTELNAQTGGVERVSGGS